MAHSKTKEIKPDPIREVLGPFFYSSFEINLITASLFWMLIAFLTLVAVKFLAVVVFNFTFFHFEFKYWFIAWIVISFIYIFKIAKENSIKVERNHTAWLLLWGARVPIIDDHNERDWLKIDKNMLFIPGFDVDMEVVSHEKQSFEQTGIEVHPKDRMPLKPVGVELTWEVDDDRHSEFADYSLETLKEQGNNALSTAAGDIFGKYHYFKQKEGDTHYIQGNFTALLNEIKTHPSITELPVKIIKAKFTSNPIPTETGLAFAAEKMFAELRNQGYEEESAGFEKSLATLKKSAVDDDKIMELMTMLFGDKKNMLLISKIGGGKEVGDFMQAKLLEKIGFLKSEKDDKK